MNVTKQSLGMGYLVGLGVVFCVVLIVHAVTALGTDASAALVALAGVMPALTLVGARVWLPRSGLEGDQIWTVAEWAGLGVAVFTLVTVAVLTVSTPSTLVPRLLASTVALGGASGVLIGTLLELRRSTRRLTQCNDVLNRVLRHNLRNDLNVVLGHLSQLDRQVSGPASEHVEQLQRKVDDIIAVTNKARQIDVALAMDGQPQEPVDVVPYLQERIDAVRAAYPDARVSMDVPDEAWVRGNWLLGTLFDNLVENAVVHADGTPELSVSVQRSADSVVIEIVDDGPPIPEAELAVLEQGAETQLSHSKGVGLWLVEWIAESYDGDVAFDCDDGGNTVTISLPSARARNGRLLLDDRSFR
ncbi:MAG: sensor histidine kinase [Haloarculaceae archaeon]